MSAKEEILHQLTEMSNWLGDESRNLVIFGEGNTSAKTGTDTFYVKASGMHLRNVTPEDFVEVNATKVLGMLDGPALDDVEFKARLTEATLDTSRGLLPSIETIFHAYLLTLPGVNFVGHTHPVSVNSIICAKNWREYCTGHIFPEEVFICGIAPALVEYDTPGVMIARKLRQTVDEYIAENGCRPRVIMLQNHGMVALGSTIGEVESITGLWDKHARILQGTMAFGGPNFMDEDTIRQFTDYSPDNQRRKLIQNT